MIRRSIAGHLVRIMLVVALWTGSEVVWSAQAFAEDVTTVYLVRHAEKDGPGDSAGLTEAGKARARALAQVLADAKLSAIFVSSLPRTALTAQPTREMTGLEPLQRNPAKTAEEIRSTFKGKKVLVVGHSDTVGKIAEELGVGGIGVLPSDAFDRLFVIHLVGEQVVLERLRYGAP